MKLAEMPRVRLAHLPTPLEFLPRLTQHLGGPRIYVKRDDQTGLAFGGNKARKLEFLAADALAQGCDTLVTTGGVQSNHARQTAAAAARLGLGCQLLLTKVVPRATPDYENSGNVLLDRLLGASVQFFRPEDFSQATIDKALASLIAEGRKPYFIPTGGSTAVGALGYVHAVGELLEQAESEKIQFRTIVVATGSAGTHAGILAGLVLAKAPAELQGYSVSGPQTERESMVRNLSEQVLKLLGSPAEDLSGRVQVDDRFVGAGYGVPTDGMIEAVKLTSRLEGLLLDPVYTGKAMAGLIHAIRSGRFAPSDQVLFWHTGGSPALFAYQDVLADSP